VKPSLLLALAVFWRLRAWPPAQTSGAKRSSRSQCGSSTPARRPERHRARPHALPGAALARVAPPAATARGQFPTLPTESLGGFGRTSFVATRALRRLSRAAIPRARAPTILKVTARPPPRRAARLLRVQGVREKSAITDGQAGIIQFGSFWGTWQGFGWQSVLDIGEEEFCDVDVCYTSDSDTAPWADGCCRVASRTGCEPPCRAKAHLRRHVQHGLPQFTLGDLLRVSPPPSWPRVTTTPEMVTTG
jgi:hypothetical protein